MNAAAEQRLRAETEELQQALQELLTQSTGLPRTIGRLERRISPFSTSFPLEELTVVFADGDRYWLFLERILGRELYQIGEVETWSMAARWIARLHHRFERPEALPAHITNRLIRFDAAYYRQWFERAERFCEWKGTSADARRVRRLGEHATDLIAELMSLPVGLIHGEFYASNVLIQETPSGLRVCPVDWERAAIGPGLIDVAAIVGGKWPEEQRVAMAMEYRDELQRIGGGVPGVAEFSRQLCACRLHLAVQWLGWSSDWSPPQDHCQDWLAEALELAQRLGYEV